MKPKSTSDSVPSDRPDDATLGPQAETPPEAEIPAEPPPPEYEIVGPSCKFLRSKGMYVYTDGSGSAHEDYDNTIFWCLRTHKSFGPDDDLVERNYCCDPSRSCYQEF